MDKTDQEIAENQLWR